MAEAVAVQPLGRSSPKGFKSRPASGTHVL